MNRRALFLDRDGVINKDYGYVIKMDQVEFIEDIFEVCRFASQLDYFIFVVTNQAGIGRGYYTEQDFIKLTEWMCGVFRSKNAPIKKVYYSPFHPEHGISFYKADSHLRKPAPGMILQAATEYQIDLLNSVLIGDKETDIIAGLKAGVGCNLLYCPSFEESVGRPNSAAMAVIKNLTESISFLKSRVA